jgi:hypothetical protein
LEIHAALQYHLNGLFQPPPAQEWAPVSRAHQGAILIEKDEYLVELSRHIHLNPVRIKKYSQLEIKEKRKDTRSHIELRTEAYGADPVFEVLKKHGEGLVFSHWT